MGKHLSNKYSQKLLDSAKKSTTDAIKTASKRAIQKTAEATGDLIGNKIADKITSVSMESSTELHSKRSHSKDKLEVPINEINDESRGGYITGSDIKFKTTMLKSSLCDYADTYILVKGTITITGAGDDAAARRADKRN